jgi:hypothetical protein
MNSRRIFASLLAIFLAAMAPHRASAQTVDSPQVLTSGQAVTGLADVQNSLRYFKLSVPANSTNATFSIGGTGDCDIYVKLGSVPTINSWQFRPYTSSSNETVSIPNPTAGDWFIMLRGYRAYGGLTLRGSFTTGGGATQTAAAPTFSPAPGTYNAQVNVALATTTPNAVIRFTTNGNAVTATSEVYNAPIIVGTTTTVRAATFATGYNTSTAVSGTFIINSGTGITTLTSAVPVTGISGTTNTMKYYKLVVPAGQTQLNFKTVGAIGDCDLYVRRGAQPTIQTYDYRPYTGGSNEDVLVANPAAGDWYVMLHAYSAYSALTLTGTFSGTVISGQPDLMVPASSLNPRISNETFDANSCDVLEGTITAGTHKLLRFTTESRNIGTGDLTLGSPASNSSFEWGQCHGHYHFASFASYRLLDGAGNVVRTGRKVGFCLMDVSRHDSSANPSARYTCSNQGIQAGWADIYSSGLSGQWVVVTGLTPGTYVLEIVIDPMNVIPEANESNNTTRQNVVIP